MTEIYDKAQWHIDAGENEENVVKKFEAIFEFLNKKHMLDTEGKEILGLGIDDSVSLHERLLTAEGNEFIKKYYDQILQKNADEMTEALTEVYEEFCSNTKR